MRRIAVMTTVALLAAALAPSASPQGRNRPRSTPPKNQATRGVLGTTQLAGDNGKIGVTYTIGNRNDAINFTLLSADYTAQRIVMKDRIIVPKADEKLLVLHYTLHNPNPREFTVNGFTLNIVAIDSKDVNHNLAGGGAPTVIKEGTDEGLGQALKPAQKVAAKTVILLPAEVSVPKLMVQRGNQVPVLRVYFKPSEVKPIPEPYKDPANAQGCAPRANVPGRIGEYYEFQRFDAKVVSTAYVEGKLMNRTPQKGYRYFVATVTAKNPATANWTLNGFTFQSSVKTDDGERTQLGGNLMLKGARDESAGLSLPPGEEYTFRIAIPVPVDAKVTELTLREGAGYRTVVFPIEPAA